MCEIQMLLLTPDISFTLTHHDIGRSNKLFPVLYKHFTAFTKDSRNKDLNITYNHSCIPSNGIILDVGREETNSAVTQEFREGMCVACAAYWS